MGPRSMQTVFMTQTIPLPSSAGLLRPTIETALQQHGEPLRWAVTAVDASTHTVQVEAVVIVAE